MKRALLTFLFFLPLWCVAQGRSAAEYPLGDTLRYDPVPYEVDLKTNLLMDATATINLGVEFPLGRRWSMDVSGNYNGWTLSDNRKWKHWMVQPEARYWLCEKFNVHFLGVHAHYADYNVGGIKFLSKNMENYRYQGNLYGAGLSYGYQWLLSNRWSMEAVIGVGWAHLDYDKYPCASCGTVQKSETKDYFGVTKAALSIIYFIK